MRAWGIGLMPLGWARFVGVSADLYSDRFVDGTVDPILPQMINLADALSDNVVVIDREAASIDGHFLALLQTAINRAESRRIENAQKALADSDVSTVLYFSKQLGMSPRSVEQFL